MTVQVVSIGLFENGSFGVFGLPIGGAELFRVDCPELREAIRQQHPALCSEFWRFTFASRSAAESAAAQQIVREAERTAAREAAAHQQAAESAKAQQSRTERVLSQVLSVAEEWATGRVAVKVARDGRVIVGRWDAPCIPGYGRPAEVRAAVMARESITLHKCRPAYRMLWG